MTVASVVKGVSDIKVRWSHLISFPVGRPRKRSEALSFADIESLINSAVDPDAKTDSNAVVIDMPSLEKLVEIRDWLDDPDYRSEYSLFGRVVWSRKKYSVEKTLVGLRFQFSDHVLATCFRMHWG